MELHYFTNLWLACENMRGGDEARREAPRRVQCSAEGGVMQDHRP
jgi:hypothetical protein